MAEIIREILSTLRVAGETAQILESRERRNGSVDVPMKCSYNTNGLRFTPLDAAIHLIVAVQEPAP